MICKNIRLNVVLRNKRRFSKLVRAGSGRQFTEEGIDSLLQSEAEQVSNIFPEENFISCPWQMGHITLLRSKKARRFLSDPSA